MSKSLSLLTILALLTACAMPDGKRIKSINVTESFIDQTQGTFRADDQALTISNRQATWIVSEKIEVSPYQRGFKTFSIETKTGWKSFEGNLSSEKIKVKCQVQRSGQITKVEQFPSKKHENIEWETSYAMENFPNSKYLMKSLESINTKFVSAEIVQPGEKYSQLDKSVQKEIEDAICQPYSYESESIQENKYGIVSFDSESITFERSKFNTATEQQEHNQVKYELDK